MLNRLTAPATRPLGRVDLPSAVVNTLPNGARLHLITHRAQPVIRLQVVFPAGRWYDTTPGVSLLTARALLEGTSTRTARRIADEVAFYGASLECEQGFDRATLTLYCLARHYDKLLPLVQDILFHAAFPEAEVEQIKTRTIQNVKVERQKSSYLAAECFSRNLYGADHPYGIVFEEERFQILTADSVRSFFSNCYILNKAEIFLCGDTSENHIQLTTDLLGLSTSSSTYELSNKAQLPLSIGSEYVPVTGSLQASLRLGRLWVSPNDSNNHRLQVLIKVLGGYFGSRLMKNIREEKGYTYGIYSSITHREQASSLIIGSEVNASNVQNAIQEIHRELKTLQDELIPEQELNTVRNYIQGKFLNELGTVFEQVDKYKTTVLLNLPSTFYTHYLDEVNSVSSSELQLLAQSYLSPIDFIEIVAGPPVN